MDALEIVNSFMTAASKRDYGTALGFMADDVEYQNMPLPAVTGHQAVRDTLDMLLAGAEGSEWIVHREATTGNLVLNERTDRFLMGGKWLELPVAGVFELADDKIVLWRDYFDLETITRQMSPA
jgi:limonene-1,2-epoxide hydrolase